MDHSQSLHKSGHSEQATQTRRDSGGVAIMREQVAAVQSPPGCNSPELMANLAETPREKQGSLFMHWMGRQQSFKPFVLCRVGNISALTLSKLIFTQSHNPSRSCFICKERTCSF